MIDRVKSITETLKQKGDVSLNDALFIWKSLYLDWYDENLHREIVKWYKTVLQFVKDGRRGNFIESLPLFEVPDLSQETYKVITDISACFNEYPKVQLLLNFSAYCYLVNNVSFVSFFDIASCEFSLSTGISSLEFLRRGTGERMAGELKLYSREMPAEDSVIDDIKAELIRQAGFPVFFEDENVLVPEEYKDQLEKVFCITPEQIISISPQTRLLFETDKKELESEDIDSGRFNYKLMKNATVALLIRRLFPKKQISFNPDRLVEYQRMQRAKETYEETDEIFLDVYVADRLKNGRNKYSHHAFSIFDDWINFVAGSGKDELLSTLPAVGGKFFDELKMPAIEKYPGYAVYKAFIFNMDLNIGNDPWLKVEKMQDRIELFSLRFGRLNKELENIYKNMTVFDRYEGVYLYGIVENDSVDDDFLTDEELSPNENVLDLAKFRILLMKKIPVVITAKPGYMASECDKFYVQNTEEVNDLLNMTAEEAFAGLEQKKMPFDRIVKTVMKNCRIAKEREYQSDWLSDR
jgi:hypothetical protein